MSVTVERHRPYFRREAQRGRRIIFEWSADERWPDDCPAYLRGDVYFEGAQFVDELAACRFDQDAMDAEYAWERFDSWEEALRWLEDEGR